MTLTEGERESLKRKALTNEAEAEAAADKAVHEYQRATQTTDHKIARARASRTIMFAEEASGAAGRVFDAADALTGHPEHLDARHAAAAAERAAGRAAVASARTNGVAARALLALRKEP